MKMGENSTTFTNRSDIEIFDLNPYSVEDWNRNLSIRLIPNSIILALYFLVGSIGNCIVITVYHFRFKNSRDDRYFIPYLAMADLSASVMCSVFTFALNFQQANFESEAFCKTMWFFSTMTTFLSVFILLSITVERYLKVCKPLSFKMKPKTKRVILIVITIVSIALAFPSTIFYGKVPTFIPSNNLTRFRCTRTRNWQNNEPVYYSFLLAICSITTPICLSVLYMRIGCKLYEHIKFRKQFQVDSLKSCSMSSLSIGSNRRLHRSGVNLGAEGTFRRKESAERIAEREKDVRDTDGIHGQTSKTKKSFIREALRKAKSFYVDKHEHHSDEFSTELSDDMCSYGEHEKKNENNCQEKKGIETTADGKLNGNYISVLNEADGSQDDRGRSERPRELSLKDINIQNHLSIRRKQESDRHVEFIQKDAHMPTTKISGKHTSVLRPQVSEGLQITPPYSPDMRRSTTKKDDARKHGHFYNMHHFSWMFMLITGICVVCYIPKIILILIEAINKTFWVDIPDDHLGLALFFYRLYIFNNVCNPIVYCFFDPRFRREMKILFKCKGRN